MIAFNERLEAANLLRLLKESRSRLADFNADDGQIARAAGVSPSDRSAMEQARLEWYLSLALWEETHRLSGRCSLVFSRIDRIQRAPYDLLACCPLTREEQERADVPPSLFAGLSAREQDRKLRLYHRLLCIQPMRRLLERLYALAKLVRESGGDREQLLAKVADPRWRSAISPLEERRSGQSLSVRDNDFTILDRLIANHGRVLRRNRVVRLPGRLLKHAAAPESLLLAAIAGGLDRSRERRTCTQYRAIPGGHVRLDVYRSGTMEDFVRKAREDQEDRPDKLVYVRPYAGYQLIQLPEEMAGLVPHEARRPLRQGSAGGRRARWKRAAQTAEASPPEHLNRAGWQELCAAICSLQEPAPVVSPGQDAILAEDNGGNGAYRMLKAGMAAAAQPARAVGRGSSRRRGAASADSQRTARPADNAQCMFEFFRRTELEPVYLARALEELRRQVALFFAADALPDKYSSEPVRPLAKSSASWQGRAIKLLLAHLAADSLIVDERVPGQIPATIDGALTRLAEDAQARADLHAFIARLESAPEAWPDITVNVRYGTLGGKPVFLCYAAPLMDDSALRAWVASGSSGACGMSREELRSACLYGLRRYLFMQAGVTAPGGRAFSLKVNRTGVPREPDLIFRLFVIHAVLRLADAAEAKPGTAVQARLVKKCAESEKSFLTITGKERIAFVEEDEQTGQQAEEFTPERLPEIASLAFQWNLRITEGTDDEDVVCLQRLY